MSEFLLRSLWVVPLLAAAQMTKGALTHEYSFNDSPVSTNAIDSVGGANGDLYPGASYPGDGTVALDGATGFVYLPDDIISNYTSITFEIWTTPTTTPTWARLFDFGTNQGGKGTGGAGGTGGNGLTWFYLCLRDGVAGSYRADINPGGAMTAPSPTPGQLHHLVFTIDAVAKTGSLYDNGRLVGFAQNFTATPQAVGHTFNDYIGRSQFADPYYVGSIDEFRIYNNPVTPVQVEADYEAGANSTTGNAGALSSIQFNNSANVVAGGKFAPAILAAYASLTNTVDISTLPGIAYTSDNTNVVSFGTDGSFHAGNPGTTTIHATYQSQSATLSVTVAAEPAVIVHRYSFNGAAGSTVISDSVGGADGTLMNTTPTAELNGTGQLNLDGNSSSAWVSLPSGIMPKLTNATFQVWMTNNDAFADWAELWAFGTNNGSQGQVYITLVPNNPATHALRFEFHGSTDTILDAPSAVPTGQMTSVTVTYNYSAQTASIFMNGRKVASGTMTLPLASIPDPNNYIGQSQWYGSGDPYLNATLDEFRIYSGVESDLQIAIDAATGPDNIVSNPGSLLSLTVVTPNTNVDVHGLSVPIQVLANFQNVTGVDVTTLAQTSVSSGNTSVGTMVNGNFLPRNIGLSTITATYNGISGSLVLDVADANPWPTLLHRYNFNEASGTTLNDSIGTINATIHGPVTLDGSKMTTPAGNPPPDGTGQPTAASGWASFPAGQGIVNTLPNEASIECWVIWQGGAVWQEMFDFGAAATPGVSTGGGTYVMISPHDGNTGALHMEWFPGGLVLTGPSLQAGVLSQVVMTHDQDRQLDKLYLNGQLISSGSNPVLWSSLPDSDNWLARDQWPDAMFNGSYADMRIWNGALTAGQVASLYAAGPNVLGGPPLQIGYTNSQVTLQWPANATTFTLQSTTNLTTGTWNAVSGTPTAVNGLNVLTVPTGSAPAFFRLH
ncbi:MAG TPA: LamG domain-containing protein [Verrucomicrobiae bacterium]|nr:LamG domain-containing protein [Verrucomicrobiae bacterium]